MAAVRGGAAQILKSQNEIQLSENSECSLPVLPRLPETATAGAVEEASSSCNSHVRSWGLHVYSYFISGDISQDGLLLPRLSSFTGSGEE